MATKRISGDYETEHKDALQTEADARGLVVTGTGANGAVTKDDLVKALNAGDAAPGPGAPAKTKSFPSNIPKVKEVVTVGGAEPKPPVDEYKGKFIRKSDGEEYALAVVRMNPLNGRTHRAMNTLHYWEGTEQQFIESFTEAGGKPLRLGDYPPKDAPKDYPSDDQKAESDKMAAQPGLTPAP